MLFIVFGKKGIYALYTCKQKCVQSLELTTMTCADPTPSLIAVLIPVCNLDKDICSLTDNLPVLSIFQLDRISLVFFCILWSTKAVFT